MELLLVRSFVELAQSGSLSAASARLGATQSAVALRVSRLEEQLATVLFSRDGDRFALTPMGQEFLLYAQKILGLWQLARESIADVAVTQTRFAIGLEPGLWHKIGAPWLEYWLFKYPELSREVRLGPADWLHQSLDRGDFEAVVTYTSLARPKIGQSLIGQERLVMVSDKPNPDLEKEYIFLDWGEAFASQHRGALPHLQNSKTYLSVGEVALDYICHQGGAGYFPERLVTPFLAQSLLYLVPEQPDFTIDIWLSWQEGLNGDVLIAAKQSLAQVLA